MNWQHEVYGPMRDRTLEAAQLHCLSSRYDLSRDSRLARAIVSTLNQALDREETRRGVQRVRTGELLIRTKRGPLIIELRTPELLERVMHGERFVSVRADILHDAENRYRALFPRTNGSTIERFLRSIYPPPHARETRRRPPPPSPPASFGKEPASSTNTSRSSVHTSKTPKRRQHLINRGINIPAHVPHNG